jgi:hypothetical protein
LDSYKFEERERRNIQIQKARHQAGLFELIDQDQ